MERYTLKATFIVALLIISTYSLIQKGPEARWLISQPFKTIRFLNDSIFFTTNNGRSFGFINSTDRGQIQVAYTLEDDEKIFEEFTTGNTVVIGHKNKSLVHFEPSSRTFSYDDRFINQNFTELSGYKEINNTVYLIAENQVRYYEKNADNQWVYTKDVVSKSTLIQGIQQYYIDLYYFPTKKNPERIFILTTAILENAEQQGEKFISCFKWLNPGSLQADGTCSYEENLNLKDFRVTGRWAYMRMGDLTFVYDQNLKMKTKWEQLPTQYVAGHASTLDQLTYLFKTNELAYYRLVENFQNDDIKIWSTQKNMNVMKKGNRMVKLNKAQNAQVIGSWLVQHDNNTFTVLIQFNTGDLHCYKIVRGDQSTQINYLFRLEPQNEQQQVEVRQEKKQESESNEGQQASASSEGKSAESTQSAQQANHETETETEAETQENQTQTQTQTQNKQQSQTPTDSQTAQDSQTHPQQPVIHDRQQTPKARRQRKIRQQLQAQQKQQGEQEQEQILALGVEQPEVPIIAEGEL